MSFSSPQLALDLSFNDRACFDNFHVADNKELVDLLKEVAVSGRLNSGVVYFYGVLGAGKSHLMFAMQGLAKESERALVYLPLNDLAIVPSMLETLDASVVVCLDNIDCWIGDKEKEEALFALYERVKQQGGCLVVSSELAVEQMSFCFTDLLSRLKAGLMYPLFSLDEQGLKIAVRMRAEYRGLNINDDAIDYLLVRLPREAGLIFALLDQIDKRSLVEQRKITIPFLRTLLTEVTN